MYMFCTSNLTVRQARLPKTTGRSVSTVATDNYPDNVGYKSRSACDTRAVQHLPCECS